LKIGVKDPVISHTLILNAERGEDWQWGGLPRSQEVEEGRKIDGRRISGNQRAGPMPGTGGPNKNRGEGG